MTPQSEGHMADVGIRQLRDSLSAYLSRVRNGEEIVVTDHGQAVARIIRIDTPRLLDSLIAEGLVTKATGESDPDLPPRVRSVEPVSPLVAEQRR